MLFWFTLVVGWIIVGLALATLSHWAWWSYMRLQSLKHTVSEIGKSVLTWTIAARVPLGRFTLLYVLFPHRLMVVRRKGCIWVDASPFYCGGSVRQDLPIPYAMLMAIGWPLKVIWNLLLIAWNYSSFTVDLSEPAKPPAS